LEYLEGNQDLALLKLAEAKYVYEKVGNLQAQATCTFNIANIHFLKGRYLEAIDNYYQSIHLIDILVQFILLFMTYVTSIN
jgi:tetratricopeptide (TPR) repeat protein